MGTIILTWIRAVMIISIYHVADIKVSTLQVFSTSIIRETYKVSIVIPIL